MAAAERHKEEDRIEVAGDQVSKAAMSLNYFYLFVCIQQFSLFRLLLYYN